MKPKLKKPVIKIGKINFKKPKLNVSKVKNPFNKLSLDKCKPLFRKVASPIIIRVLVGVCIFAAVVQIVFGVLLYGFKSYNKVTRVAAKIVPFPIAVANQDVITYNEFLSERDYIHHFYESTQQESMDLKSVDSEILNQLIENKLISFQAWKNGIKVSDAEVDATLDGIIQQNGGKDKVEKVLTDLYGLKLNQFKDLVKTQLIRDKVNTDLIEKVEVSHILVRVDQNAPQDQVDAAKVKIEGYLKEIQGGLDFADAAKKYSEDTGSADSGGKLDPFSRGEMVDEFSNAAFSAKVGDLVGPIRTSFGWHLIKVEGKTGKIDKSFTDWLDGLKNPKKNLIIKFIK